MFTGACIKYEADHIPKVFPGRGESLGGLTTIIGENNNSGITDSYPSCGQPQTTHTTAKITNVKDLALTFLISVFNSSGLRLLSKNILTKHFRPFTQSQPSNEMFTSVVNGIAIAALTHAF